MDEEIKKDVVKEEVKKEEPEVAISNIGEGDKPQTTTLIDDANLAAKRMEEANKEKKALLDREEDLAARRALGGRAEGGGTQEVKKETDEEYVARFERGEANPLKDDAE